MTLSPKLYSASIKFQNNKPSLHLILSRPISSELDKRALSMASYSNFKQTFARFDTNGDGKLSPVELQCLLRCIGHELSLQDAEVAIESGDLNGDGKLDMDEFIQFVGDKGDEEERELREAFEMYVMKGEGCITAKSLRRMLSRLGTSKDVEECMAMICRFDANGDGVLDFDEFKGMMG